jgi:hypothetical protein
MHILTFENCSAAVSGGCSNFYQAAKLQARGRMNYSAQADFWPLEASLGYSWIEMLQPSEIRSIVRRNISCVSELSGQTTNQERCRHPLQSTDKHDGGTLEAGLLKNVT